MRIRLTSIPRDVGRVSDSARRLDAASIAPYFFERPILQEWRSHPEKFRLILTEHSYVVHQFQGLRLCAGLHDPENPGMELAHPGD